MPACLKLPIMLAIDMSCNQAELNMPEKLYQVTTFPGFRAQYFWHSSPQCCLSEPNVQLSSGCSRWVVWGGRQKIITPSVAAACISSG